MSTRSLTREEILAELLADNLSDVPDVAIPISDSDDDSDGDIFVNRRDKNVRPLPSYSESDLSADESDSSDTHDGGTVMWTKRDRLPNLGQFIGNPGVKEFPSDSSKVAEVTELFLETIFLKCCVRKQICISIKIRRSMLQVLRG